jgi:hypothetical protein
VLKLTINFRVRFRIKRNRDGIRKKKNFRINRRVIIRKIGWIGLI